MNLNINIQDDRADFYMCYIEDYEQICKAIAVLGGSMLLYSVLLSLYLVLLLYYIRCFDHYTRWFYCDTECI